MGQTALLIIDMQNDFYHSSAPLEVAGALKVAGKIKKALNS
jgi:nicotinamidase-related amidase